MKKFLIIVAAISIGLSACKKNTLRVTDPEPATGLAMIKFGLANMTNPSSLLTVTDNGTRITGALSLTLPYPYPGGGYNTNGGSSPDYFGVKPGTHKFETFMTLLGSNTYLGKFQEFTYDLLADTYYTVYTADSGATATSVLAIDTASRPTDSGFVKLRFVNLIPNSTGLDLYKDTTLLHSNISYKGVTDFLSFKSGTTDTFYIRPTGQPRGFAAQATAFYRLSLNTNRRVMSVIATGYLSTAAPKAPRVSLILNK